MTHFMAYVILLSSAIGATSLVAELVMRTRAGSTRWIWMGALGAALTVAAIVTFVPAAVRDTRVPEVRAVKAYGVAAVPITVVVDAESRADTVLRIMDAALPVAWATSSAMLLIAILHGQRRLARERRASRLVRIHGREVLLTESVGPAVAGVGRPFVLLPRWALALDTTSQELLLAHEFEHVHHGDTRFLLTGAVAVALMPWNPVVWWLSRRLRLAVERDCDARVLAAHPDVRRYADLLLTAASRHGVSTRLLAAHFGEYHSDLEARIRTMTDKRLKWRTALATATVSVALIVMSCEVPRPEPIAPSLEQESTEPKQLVSPTDVLLESQVEKPVTAAGFLTPRYPEILRQAGVEGEVLVSFVVDEDGNADTATLKVVQSTHELFTIAVKNALPAMRFNPAEAGGRKVKQLVEQPFSFTLPGTTPAASREESTVGSLVAVDARKLAYTVRPQDALMEEANVVVYASDGTELARSGRKANLLSRIEPRSIHSMEVIKPRACPASLTCPLIKITLAKGQTLGGSTVIRPTRDTDTMARAQRAEPRTTDQPSGEAIKATMVEQDGRREARGVGMVQWPAWTRNEAPNIVVLSVDRMELRRVLAADVHKNGVNAFDEILPADVAAIEYHGRAGCAPFECPLLKVIIRPGREAAYRKR